MNGKWKGEDKASKTNVLETEHTQAMRKRDNTTEDAEDGDRWTSINSGKSN